MVSTASGWPWRTPAPAAGAWGRGSEGWKCKKQGEPSTPRRKISAESLRVQCNETTTQAKETSRRLQQRGRREHLRDDRRDNSDGGCACQRARCTIHHQYTQTQRQRVGVRGGATATGAEGGREATWRPIATLRPAWGGSSATYVCSRNNQHACVHEVASAGKRSWHTPQRGPELDWTAAWLARSGPWPEYRIRQVRLPPRALQCCKCLWLHPPPEPGELPLVKARHWATPLGRAVAWMAVSVTHSARGPSGLAEARVGEALPDLSSSRPTWASAAGCCWTGAAHLAVWDHAGASHAQPREPNSSLSGGREVSEIFWLHTLLPLGTPQTPPSAPARRVADGLGSVAAWRPFWRGPRQHQNAWHCHH